VVHCHYCVFWNGEFSYKTFPQMSVIAFAELYEIVSAREEGWRQTLVDSWPCLTQEQKSLLETI
jgi:hypothetical protein